MGLTTRMAAGIMWRRLELDNGWMETGRLARLDGDREMLIPTCTYVRIPEAMLAGRYKKHLAWWEQPVANRKSERPKAKT